VPAWRFTRQDRPAAGLGSRSQLRAAYARHAGVEVDPAALAWWELAGTLRWGVITVMQAFTHLSGAAPSLEHAVIGRRACEVEWDLLGMLAPAGASRDDLHAISGDDAAAAARPTLHDRPTAVELLEATRSALGDDVLPGVDGRAAFQLRVALRALGIVERELASSSPHVFAHARALALVGHDDEASLAAAIRAGALDGREDELFAALCVTVRAKLEAANPRYLQIAQDQPAKEEQ
jgi:hypothetical protein